MIIRRLCRIRSEYIQKILSKLISKNEYCCLYDYEFKEFTYFKLGSIQNRTIKYITQYNNNGEYIDVYDSDLERNKIEKSNNQYKYCGSGSITYLTGTIFRYAHTSEIKWLERNEKSYIKIGMYNEIAIKK